MDQKGIPLRRADFQLREMFFIQLGRKVGDIFQRPKIAKLVFFGENGDEPKTLWVKPNQHFLFKKKGWLVFPLVFLEGVVFVEPIIDELAPGWLGHLTIRFHP